MSSPHREPVNSVQQTPTAAQLLGVPGEDYPELGTVLDVIPASSGDAYMCWMDDVADEEFVVSLPNDLARRPLALGVGERIEVIWKASGALRCLPVVLAGIDLGEPPHWRLRPVGVVQRGQRRDAVRAPLRLPVVVGTGVTAARGMTLDLSEGGLRCLLDRQPEGIAAAPDRQEFDVGNVVPMSTQLPALTVQCLSEVTRSVVRDGDGRTDLSLRFIGLPERIQDDVRRHVFARLRELRQRGLL
jgi:hypothetical protein